MGSSSRMRRLSRWMPRTCSIASAMSPRCPIFSTSSFSMTCMRLLPPDHVRQKRHLASAFDRGCGLALVLRAETGDPTSADLAAVRDEPPEHVVVLVVHVGYVLLAEDARLVLARAPLCTRTPSPTHRKTSPSVWLARGLGRQRPVGVRRREPDDHVPQHVVRDAQNSLQ